MSSAPDSNPSIKNQAQYEALREQGASKEKAARIANSSEDQMDHDSRPYEDRTKEELYDQARTVGIEGRSGMSKDELIDALRSR